MNTHTKYPAWTFLTNHGHVIVLVSQNRDLTTRQMAEQIGITERACQKIVSDLHSEGYIQIKKSGRKNTYSINSTKKLRHPIEQECEVKTFFEALIKSKIKGSQKSKTTTTTNKGAKKWVQHPKQLQTETL